MARFAPHFKPLPGQHRKIKKHQTRKKSKMAKFNLGINLSDAGVAEGREAWSGELPPTGSYSGVLKIISLGEIGPDAKNAGKPKLSIGVELKSEKGSPSQKYDGYIAWGNLNLIPESAPFINQFLLALTDGSDASLAKIQNAFQNNITWDERKKHVVKIGNLYVNSPEGELPIKVSIQNTPFHNKKTGVTTQQVRIQSYLLGAGSAIVGDGGSTDGPQVSDVEEEASVDLTPEAEDEDGIEEAQVEIDSEDGEPVDAEELLS